MIKGIGLTIAFLLAALCMMPDVRAKVDGWEEDFFKANQSYRENKFQEAIEGYLRLIRSGHGGGQVYYNLGNAYFRASQLGRAILEYERALLLMPRDPDLKFNLSHARDQTRDAILESRGSMGTVFFWLGSFSLNELFWCLAVLNILLWAALLIRLFHRAEWLYYMLLLIVSCWFVAGLSFGLKCYLVSSDDRAVILQKEVNILAGPETDDTVLFKLHEGTLVNQERKEDGWSLVCLPDQKRGWIKSEAVGLIAREASRPPETGIPSTSPHPLRRPQE
ncbi:MAG: tetratricopeptide repeat protein [Proteobacteria bacterium]|nr:tetratricopeptide repeat protein [Pseudomonadota bacterium]MBU1902951.1 tetratricopeptide repeat protein [Pseudomonadota bacterium]